MGRLLAPGRICVIAGAGSIIFVETIKLFLDGMPFNGTAALEHHYADGHHFSGYFTHEQIHNYLTVLDQVEQQHGIRFDTHCHCIGEGALLTVMAMIKMQQAGKPPKLSVAHCDIVSAHRIKTLAENGVSFYLSWLMGGDARSDLYPLPESIV